MNELNDRGKESIVYIELWIKWIPVSEAERASVLDAVLANWGERGLVGFKTAGNWIKFFLKASLSVSSS